MTGRRSTRFCWRVLVAALLWISLAGSSPTPAAAAGACDLDAVAIADVRGYERVDPSVAEGISPEVQAELRGIDAADHVLMRFWTDGTGGAVMLFVRDEATAGEARRGRPHFIEGVEEWAGPPVGAFEVVGVPMAAGTWYEPRGIAIAAAEAPIGRIYTSVMVLGTGGQDQFAASLLARQAARLPTLCVEDDESLLSDPGQRQGRIQGAAIGLVMTLVGCSWLVARVRTRGSFHRLTSRPVQAERVVELHDVSRWGQVRRHRAVYRMSCRLVGLVLFIAGGISAVDRNATATWAQLLAAAAVGLVLPRADRLLVRGDAGPLPPRRLRWLREGRLRLGAMVTAAVAVFFGAVALLGGVGQARLSAISDNEVEVRAAVAEMSVDTYRNAFLLLLLIPGAICVALYRVARRVAHRDAQALLQRDGRDAVLLLRGFGDDTLRMRVTPSKRHSWLGALGIQQVERFEEVLAWSLTPYGPVTAIAQPGVKRTPLGAARESLQDEDWLRQVVLRAQRARLIVVVVGVTTGLHQEVASLRNNGLLDRTLFVIPPVAPEEAAARWWTVASALGPSVVPPYPWDPGDPIGLVLHVEKGRVRCYVARDRRDVSYEAAIDAAVASLPELGEPTQVTSTVAAPVPSAWGAHAPHG